MSHEVICTWLGVSTDRWPPDHYLLLGLPPGESSAERIEQAVESRLGSVRQYQLTHPELATEAMNRIAQAFVCLTDTGAKRAYDHKLFGGTELPPKPDSVDRANDQAAAQREQEEAANAEAMAVTSEPVIWLNQAIRAMQSSTTTLEIPLLSAVEADVEESAPEPESATPSVPEPLPDSEAPEEPSAEPELVEEEESATPEPEFVPEPVDPSVEAARTASAQKGLATKRAFYYRLACTRALLYVWDDLAEYLNESGRRLGRPAEARKLMRCLNKLRQELTSFPPLLGNAGQPGYLVVALARQQVVVPTFQTLLPSQREALARDWQAGRKLLVAHKAFIREELQSLRKKSQLGRLLRMGRSFLNENPLGILLVLGLLAIAVAVWRTLLSS